jgi:hypothetical protein
LDARRALIALRKAGRSPEQISLLVRDREIDSEAEDQGDVMKSMVENALDAVGNWLLGIAALIVPEHGTLLVAGPLGAALAGMHHDTPDLPDTAVPVIAAASDHDDDEVDNLLIDFGFNRDEARYIAHRLDAGDSIVAVTTSVRSHIHATRRAFADQDAVHIGQARTRSEVAHEALALLAVPVAAAGTEVVVTDAVTPLRRLCQDAEAEPWIESMCRAQVVDRDGDEVGTVDEILADAISDNDSEDPFKEIRYIVIGFGGVLGIGRHRVAVPVHLVRFETEPARLLFTRDLLQRAPDFDPEEPFSRREEESVFAYFGTMPYWDPEASRPIAEGVPLS